jgi:hypothetical protein
MKFLQAVGGGGCCFSSMWLLDTNYVMEMKYNGFLFLFSIRVELLLGFFTCTLFCRVYNRHISDGTSIIALQRVLSMRTTMYDTEKLFSIHSC